MVEELRTQNAVTQRTTYQYDAVGNRLSRDENGMVTQYFYDSNGRLAQSVGNGVQTQYLYDANGNLTQQQSALKTFDYQWNTLNQLSKVTTGNVTIEYKYNAAGQRHQRFRTEGAQRQETLYLFDNERPYAEAVAEWQRVNNGAWQVTRYVHSLDGTGDLLTILKEGQRYSVHHDGLSSTRLLSDSTATPQTALNYSTFGEPLSTNPANPLTTYQFAGEYYDADTGLIYLRARWMNPTLGRFISMDKFEGAKGLLSSLNKYVYADNDPVNLVDPSGYFTLGGMMSGINIAFMAYSTFDLISGFISGEREFSAKEIGIAILWAYAGSKAGVLFGGLEKALRRSGCFGNSFTGDTLVETVNGLKRIDEIQANELVLSFNSETGENEFQPVLAVMTSTKLTELTIITLDSGEKIEATPDHRIFANGDWVEAKNIKVGSQLTTANKQKSIVRNITQTIRHISVYDLSIDKNQNFFVSKDKVLVHNISVCEKAAQALAKAVPKSCLGLGQCKEFAKELETLLLKKGMQGQRLCLKSRTGRIWSDKNEMISTNGDHMAIQVGDLVFDNMFPDGIPFSQWANDLGVGYPGMDFESIDIGKGKQCKYVKYDHEIQ